MSARAAGSTLLLLSLAVVTGCGDDDAAPADAGAMRGDAGPVAPASTAHCDYQPMPSTARAGGTVSAGPVSAGAAEAPLGIPVGATLGAYTARAGYVFGTGNKIDQRYVELAGAFIPSIGIETRPMVRAVALTAGDETIVLLHADVGIADDELSFRVAQELGPDFAGKVAFFVSHTHSGFGNYTSHEGMQVGFGAFRAVVQRIFVDALAGVARAALDARVPARIGIAHDPEFDLDDRVSRDRRSENDDLAGGSFDDHDLFVIRIDAAADGSPIAIVPIFGMHGTVMGPDNQLASTDAPGGVVRALEESFDREVVVMHLQGAGGDVSPAGSGGLACDGLRFCHAYARTESIGRAARDAILAAWEEAEAAATDTLAVEMVTRSIALGPDWRNFTIRDGMLEYAPWDGETDADGVIWGDDGAILSPIDEFNAPVGAALCGEMHDAFFPMGQLPGTLRASPYRSCLSVDVAADVLGDTFLLPFGGMPVCGSTRTTISAIRLGDHLLATVPGEPLTLYASHLRSLSPVAPERTIVLGYAQDHIGYLLTAEDWLRMGYEPSINFWGPLEGEYVAERAAALMEVAMTDAREDAAADGADRWSMGERTDDLPPPDPAPMAGTIPASVPAEVFAIGPHPIASPRPPASLERLAVARLVFLGEDPLAGTPRARLERETAPGSGEWEAVRRRSGRPVVDQDLLLFHTPVPLMREGTEPRTHYWVVVWQAVTPWGTPGLDEVDDRAGLPLGRYRVHVEGTGYTVDSDPIDVVAATLSVRDAAVSGSTLTLTAGYESPDGFRLLDPSAPSNRFVPLRRGPVTVVLSLAGGGTRTVTDATVGGDGTIAVTLLAGETVTEVEVEDRFTNAGRTTP